MADGSKQHSLYNKDNITSPTISTDVLMMTLVIDAMEERVVGIGDIPRAYLQANMTDLVYMKMRGESVEVMCQLDPDMKQFEHEYHHKLN